MVELRTSLEDAIAWTIMAYLATPHPTTGSAPGYLMLGVDMCLPGMQDLQVLDPVIREVQLKVLKWAQRAVAQGLAVRHPKAEGVKLEGIEESNIVVYLLSEEEQRRRAFMGGKSLPKWSEPCRVLKVLSTSPHSPVIVSSLWTKKQRQVARAEVRKLSPVWNKGLQELANCVLLYEQPLVIQEPSKWQELVEWRGGPVIPGIPPPPGANPHEKERDEKPSTKRKRM
eukprot:GHVN01041663.1.p1 GENE.GHVN01041663.1~~GHVN01041663.1.p1  ORF type:complete len:227 (-),score=37.02 GHVN01041663.1:156-836(-)